MKSSIMDDPKKKEITKKRHFSFRINIFFFVTFLLFSVLIVRLAILQFVQAKDLKAAENTNTNQTNKIAPIRGNIYDSTKSPLAYTIPVQSLFFRIEPGQDKDANIDLAKRIKSEVFDKFAKPNTVSPTAEEIVLAMDLGYDINKKPVKDPSYYSVPRRIKADLSNAEIAFLLEHRDEYKGLEVTEESIRTYEVEDDKTTIATQLVGYTNAFSTETAKKIYKDNPNSEEYLSNENVGFDGIERMYQDELRGKNGSKKYPVNAAMKIIGRAEVTAPIKGNNLYLSINKDVQKATEKMLHDHIQYLRSPSNANDAYLKYGVKASSGFAVAMEVDTGRVITMANYPDYDANAWTGGMATATYKEIETYIQNGTITTAKAKYPDAKENAKHPSSIVFMGSTIKPLSVLIGLKEKFFSAGVQNYNDTGTFTFGRDGNSSISNSDRHAYGSLNASSAIEVSSNTYMSAMVGIPFWNKYGRENAKVTAKWAEYLAKFGMGVQTGSGLPGEYAGSNDFIKNAEKDSYQSAMVYASWGQNEKTTTLQLAQYTATLASRGKRMKPQFVEEIRDYQGNLVKTIEPEVLDDSSKEFSQADWNTIIHGMKSGAQGIDELPFNVARKTGTSTQDVAGGRVENAVLIAFAPVENPKLAVAVVVPEGGFGRYGASPIAAKIFEAYDAAYGGVLTKLGGGKRPW
ncbi:MULTISPECIES: peptidoglycan D,D-transpeptidase FtsI family protein [unclassified Paenibacillus]|uniref:peptidoglycan D,D-transpeptidase FtsI family protein n=1 Tax=unclassified Paenibacillus TaxID=185978 RepID=UPI0006F94A07|nr:penicillin-binding transpeptidase domain-containing protein [Paenibacillus sp. Soil750]KRE70817.1 cell division protein FtsI [Paenibacillus sp. Soil750]